MITKRYILPWVDSSILIHPTAIVLHWWQAPTWFGGIRWFIFELKRKKLSVQYAVLKDGTIYRLTESPNVWCRHARCANDSSIGIEIQGLGARDLDKNAKQFESVVTLVKDLCREYAIQTEFNVEEDNGLRFFGIGSHKWVDTYCGTKRWVSKRDVHDDYIKRIVAALSDSH